MNYEQDYLRQERAIVKSYRRHLSKILGKKIDDDGAIRALVNLGFCKAYQQNLVMKSPLHKVFFLT